MSQLDWYNDLRGGNLVNDVSVHVWKKSGRSGCGALLVFDDSEQWVDILGSGSAWVLIGFFSACWIRVASEV